MSIAENLKRIRKQRGFSQAQLAEASGVAQQLISQIENGKNNSTKRLPELAKALGCAVHDIDENYYLASGEDSDDILAKFKQILDENDASKLRDLEVYLDFLRSRTSQPDGSS